MENQENLITDSNRVTQIIQGLAREHSRLQIILPDQNESASSMILGIEPGSETLLLDEIMPGYVKVDLDSELIVHGKLKGVPLRFRTRIDAVEQSDGVDAYACKFPEQMFYDQKRSDFRFSPGIASRPRMQFFSDDPPTAGEIINISAGGAKVPLLNQAEEISENVEIQCQLTFEEDQQLDLTVRVCHRREDPVHLGLQFLSMTAKARRFVQSWIANSERKLVRRLDSL